MLSAFLFLTLCAVVNGAEPPTNELVCNDPVIARVPPKDGPPNPKFKDAPPGYHSGRWFQTYSSINDTVLDIRNIQLLSTYNVKKDLVTDVSSYNYGDCPHIYTLYVIRNGTKYGNDNYPEHEPGTNITHHQDLVAYGRDSACHGYFVLYGKEPDTPGLIIASTIQAGPTKKTLKALKSAFLKLNHADIAKAVKNLRKIPFDGARSGDPDYICDHKCQTNQNTPTGTCPST